METLFRDLERGIRRLIRTPVVSLAAVLTLGVGIGATAFSYSVSYVFMELPVDDSHRLMVVRRTSVEGDSRLPFHDFEDIRVRQSVFSSLAAGYEASLYLSAEGRHPQRLFAGYVTARAFEGMGISPILGRAFQDGDDTPGAPNVLLLGFAAWRSYFAEDRDVVGQTVLLNGEPATVIGVMPENFGFPVENEAWVPLRSDPTTLERGGGSRLLVWGYLNDGIDQSGATAELRAIAAQLEAEHPELNEGVSARALPFMEALFPSQLFTLVGVLMAMNLGVLLVACTNVANLLLARATLRERDVAVQAALGAKRSQVIRQMLMEALAMAMAGGILGLVFVHFAFPWYESLFVGVPRPYWFIYSLKPSALVFTALVTISAALLAGTIPAVRASGASVGTVLRHAGGGASNLRVGRFSRGLVVAEVAVSCALLMGAGLLGRSVLDLNRIEPGFDGDRVLTARVAPLESDYPDVEARNSFFNRLLEEVRADPGVEASALTSLPPGTNQYLLRFRQDGVEYPLPRDVPTAAGVVVTDGFFETFGIQVEEGRDFSSAESERGGEEVVIVNRAFVERYFDDSNPIGHRIGLGVAEAPSRPWLRIVGVVSNTHQGMDPWDGRPRQPEVLYRPLGLVDPGSLTVAVRTRGDPAAFAPRLRDAAARADGNLPLYWVYTMEETLFMNEFVHRGMGMVVVIIGLAGLFMAVVGLYGVTDFAVSSRLREMGIRVALGSPPWSVLGLVYRGVLVQLGLGSAIGLALGLGLGKPLSAALSGVPSWDLGVVVIVLSLLSLTCLAAAVLPATRALRVDPLEALKAE